MRRVGNVVTFYLLIYVFIMPQRDCGFTHRWCPSVCPFVCLSPKCKNTIFSKTKQFIAMVSI